ncbi:hypothetical protein TraAM80_04014 [Trypanosoma rangeli]|uniref:Syntaxin n=1 Tax=Trypanosoma rangeli TaxID=5698 RepID=A0A422NLX7_TRYRA|nr:uncharacterized protein TraAM80_04014 [Trypanosoma rangeli]RNF06510.1 hypothetical protein TraAM80_04014 [Trypanosoma rangeli]|eukprot:RNF06510.1 hypothetical protein TraAM80_04014 [Trypanosoma rangeli]
MAEFIALVPHHEQRPAPHGGTSNDNRHDRNSTWLPVNDETRPIFTSLSKIRLQVEALEALHLGQLVELRAEKRERVRDAVEKLCSECHFSREMIHMYNCTTQKLAEGIHDNPYPLNMAELRMRHNIAMFMEYQLMSWVRAVWEAQKVQEERLIDATARRVKARFGMTDAGGGEISNKGEMSVEHAREVARRLVVTGNEERLFLLARDELERVMCTRDAVLELERDMRDLLQLFSDLQLLVQGQHDQLTMIQQSLERSCQRVVVGAQHIQMSKKYAKPCCAVL